MAKTIWKFMPQLNNSDMSVATVDMPAGARVLAAREQGDELCIWAEVDPSEVMQTRYFHVFGTGHKMPDDPGAYVGTALLYSGTLVLHVYAVKTQHPK